MSQDATNHIKTALVRRALADFQVSRVEGLDSNPLFIQDKPIPGEELAPFVYFSVGRAPEVDKTKEGSSKDYNCLAQIVVESPPNESKERVRDSIANELVRIIDAPQASYLDLTPNGFHVYIQNASVSSRQNLPTNRGKTVYLANVEIMIRAEYHTEIAQNQNPSQAAVYTKAFTRGTPGANVENFDTGTITGATSYSSGNNGWDFTSVDYSIPDGYDGTLVDNVLTVGADDEDLALKSEINYVKADDNTQTFTIEATTVFPRIRSLRFGSLDHNTVTEDDLKSFSEWDDFHDGVVNPNNRNITITGDAGDYEIIVIDEDHELAEIENILQGNDINNFTKSNVSGYDIYVSNNPIYFDDTSFSYTLKT